MIRRNALLVLFLGAFSVNHLFLFSEFVSWTIIDGGEPPMALRMAQPKQHGKWALGQRQALDFAFLRPLTFLRGWEEIDEHPWNFVSP